MGFEKHDWESIWTQPTQPWVESGGDQSLRLIYPELLTLRGEFSSGSTALVPLCGDSTAVRYLFDRGHRVTAVDFVPDAVRKLAQTQFADAEFAHTIDSTTTLLSGERVRLIAQDFNDFDAGEGFDLIYDRGALVALSHSQRALYIEKLLESLKPEGLLIVVADEFSVPDWSGPPYPLTRQEVEQLFPTLGCVWCASRNRPLADTDRRYSPSRRTIVENHVVLGRK